MGAASGTPAAVSRSAHAQESVGQRGDLQPGPELSVVAGHRQRGAAAIRDLHVDDVVLSIGMEHQRDRGAGACAVDSASLS